MGPSQSTEIQPDHIRTAAHHRKLDGNSILCEGTHAVDDKDGRPGCHNEGCRGRKYCIDSCRTCPDHVRHRRSDDNTACQGYHAVDDKDGYAGCHNERCRGRKYCIESCHTCPDVRAMKAIAKSIARSMKRREAPAVSAVVKRAARDDSVPAACRHGAEVPSSPLAGERRPHLPPAPALERRDGHPPLPTRELLDKVPTTRPPAAAVRVRVASPPPLAPAPPEVVKQQLSYQAEEVIGRFVQAFRARDWTPSSNGYAECVFKEKYDGVTAIRTDEMEFRCSIETLEAVLLEMSHNRDMVQSINPRIECKFLPSEVHDVQVTYSVVKLPFVQDRDQCTKTARVVYEGREEVRQRLGVDAAVAIVGNSIGDPSHPVNPKFCRSSIHFCGYVGLSHGTKQSSPIRVASLTCADPKLPFSVVSQTKAEAGDTLRRMKVICEERHVRGR